MDMCIWQRCDEIVFGLGWQTIALSTLKKYKVQEAAFVCVIC